MKLTKGEKEQVEAFLVRLDNVIAYCKAHGGRIHHPSYHKQYNLKKKGTK